MKRFSQLNYQTEKVQMSTTILESMINNMGQKIKNMSVKIQFVSHQQKRGFLTSEQRIKQQSDVISLCSDHSDEKDENQGQNQANQTISIRPKEKKAKGIVEQKRVVQVPFEMSILLKEKYSNKLEKIGRRLNVEFIVVPTKVKIIGIKSDLLDQAFQEFGMLQDKINLVPISDYGKEVFQSKYYKNLLKQSQLQILKILDKYYFWFQEGTANPKQLIKDIFVLTKHKIFPFGKPSGSKYRQKDVQAIKVAHGSFSWLKLKTSIINALTIKIEAIIFQKYVQNELNRLEKRIERKVELSEDRENLILHLDADQQIVIQEDNIRSAYQPFRYVFLLFDKDINLEYLAQFLNTYNSISSKDRFRKKKAQVSDPKLFFTERIQNFVVIAYYEDKDKNVSAQNQEAYIQQHQLMQFFKKMHEELLNFKLILRSLMGLPDQQGEFKKFSFQKDPNQKITFVSCKNQRRKNYQIMVSLFIQKKFVSQVIKKQQPIKEPENQNSLSIDLSRPIDQSSIILNNSNNLSFSLQNEVNANNTAKVLPQQLSVPLHIAFRFEEYSLCLLQRPEDRQKRYSDLFDVVKKTASTVKNPQLQRGLNIASASKYKIWGLNVPLKYKQISLRDQADAVISVHPQLEKYNRQVTVFYGGKQLKDFENIYAEDKKLKVYKIEEKPKGKQDIKIKEGYLLKTNVVFLYLQFMESGLTDLPIGKYEALYYVKKLEP